MRVAWGVGGGGGGILISSHRKTKRHPLNDGIYISHPKAE